MDRSKKTAKRAIDALNEAITLKIKIDNDFKKFKSGEYDDKLKTELIKECHRHEELMAEFNKLNEIYELLK
ncbi:hypothetical protein TPELB_21320 [Terrisporobacter petrolearius]|uniref:Uncharacterized protein n=1 Tax=Terrisporobacter petrolearius TaxID=1460447 RepID=A0ABZ3FGF9_9FIRM